MCSATSYKRITEILVMLDIIRLVSLGHWILRFGIVCNLVLEDSEV